MAQSQTNRLGEERVGKLLFQLAVPAITAQIINALYNIVDRIYIGHIPDIGATALTGVGITFPIILLIAAFSSLIGMGGGPRASIKMGEGDYAGAERIMGNCFALLLGISVVLTAFFLLFQRPLLLLFGASADSLPYAMQYMTIYVSGTIFVQLALGLNSFITTQGFAKTSMFTVIIGAGLNIVLDPVFIFVFQMGVQGAAVATVLSQAISSIWVLWFLFGKRTVLKLRPKNFRLNHKIVLPVLALGLSPFIMQATESAVNIVLNSSLQRYGGDTAVGAMTICSSVMQVAFMPLTGLAQGAQPIVSFNFGAKQNDRVKKAFHLLFLSSIAFSTLFWLALMLFPNAFVRLFTPEVDLASFTAWALRIYMSMCLVLGVQCSCQQTFVAIGQAKTSLFLALLRKVFLLIPLILLLPHFFADKVLGVFLAEPIADFLAATTTGLIFFIRFRRLLAKNQTKSTAIESI